MEHFSLNRFPVFIMGIIFITLSAGTVKSQSQDNWTTLHLQKAEQFGSSSSDHRSLELLFITSDKANNLSADVIFNSEKEALEAFLSASFKKDIHTFYVITEKSSSKYLNVWQAVDKLLAIENK